ncbi:MAG: urease accessory protein UreH domain-containing protein [Actinomycetota bacterium]
MLASINPLVERSKNSRFAITFTAFVIGSLAGGALFGAVAGGAGAAVRAVAPWSRGATAIAVVVVCVVALVLDLRLVGLRPPTVRRQVNEDWLTEYRGWVYGLGFGFQLGMGVVTIVTTATVYVTFVFAFLTGSLPFGIVIGTVFGLVRALPMVLVTRVREPAELRRTVRRAQAWAPIAQRAAVASLLAAGTVGVVAVVS